MNPASIAPGPLGLVLVTGALYVLAVRRARRTAGARALPAWRIACGIGGVAALGAALLSPVDRLGEESFTMHMVQHLLLADVGPVLLLLGLTKVALRPVSRRLLALEEALGPLGSPWIAVVVYVGVMWGWHVPPFYDLTLRNDVVHTAGHVLFLSAGGLYWWHLLSPVRRRLRFGGFAPVVYMVVTKLLVGALGAALTFAPEALYDAYEDRPRIAGLSAVEDQAVGGAIMAIEQSVVMGVALAVLFVRALAEDERREQRRERFDDGAT
jgi:putative membrane protein